MKTQEFMQTVNIHGNCKNSFKQQKFMNTATIYDN